MCIIYGFLWDVVRFVFCICNVKVRVELLIWKWSCYVGFVWDCCSFMYFVWYMVIFGYGLICLVIGDVVIFCVVLKSGWLCGREVCGM